MTTKRPGSAAGLADAKKQKQAGPSDDPAIQISGKYNAEDADLNLVSSDGMHFKVHSAVLIRQSQVFKDLLAVPGSEAERQSVIALSDENDEEAESLEDFLDILHDDDEIWDTVDCPTWRIKRAIRLLDKYYCPSARKRFARRVRLDRFASGSVQDADLTFHISMLLDDPLGCKEAIVAAASGSQRFEDLHDTAIQYGKGSMQNPVEGGHYLDVRAWSLNTVKECRVEYMVALSRAWLIVDKDGPKEGQLKEVADEFYRLMTR